MVLGRIAAQKATTRMAAQKATTPSRRPRSTIGAWPAAAGGATRPSYCGRRYPSPHPSSLCGAAWGAAPCCCDGRVVSGARHSGLAYGSTKPRGRGARCTTPTHCAHCQLSAEASLCGSHSRVGCRAGNAPTSQPSCSWATLAPESSRPCFLTPSKPAKRRGTTRMGLCAWALQLTNTGRAQTRQTRSPSPPAVDSPRQPRSLSSRVSLRAVGKAQVKTVRPTPRAARLRRARWPLPGCPSSIRGCPPRAHTRAGRMKTGRRRQSTTARAGGSGWTGCCSARWPRRSTRTPLQVPT
mmetsp:Transcript_40563/g.134246  ORF Transcript_40563/g.134246 Transcript_40563/m.134246 type:complete len:296 (+) Transcript_40563:139-1026(+)